MIETAYVNRCTACKYVNRSGGLTHLHLPDQSAIILSQGLKVSDRAVHLVYQEG